MSTGSPGQGNARPRFFWPGARFADRTRVSKSPVIVGAIGLAGCVALSFMMRSALSVQQQRQRDPLADELEARFGRRLDGPVEVGRRLVDGKNRLVIQLRVHAGLRKSRFVKPAGITAWNRKLGAGELPDEIEVEVVTLEPRETVSRLVDPPWPTQPGSSEPWFEPPKVDPGKAEDDPEGKAGEVKGAADENAPAARPAGSPAK